MGSGVRGTHSSKNATSGAAFSWWYLSQFRLLLLLCFSPPRGITKMLLKKLLIALFAGLMILTFSASAADKKSKDASATNNDASKPSYELPQPATETLDFTMYQRIRDEGLQ